MVRSLSRAALVTAHYKGNLERLPMGGRFTFRAWKASP